MDSRLDGAPCGYLEFRDDGSIIEVNRTLLDMLAYERDDIIGASIERILTVGTRVFYQTHFFPLIRLHGNAEEIFLLLRGASGEEVAVLANARRTGDGDQATNVCVFMRVRERQKFEAELLRARREAQEAQLRAEQREESLAAANEQLEQQALELELTSEELRVANMDLEERTFELERQREIADEANLAKSNFLAMMSHELRTPLNAISGYAELLEMGVQGPVNDAQRDSLLRIKESQRHLLRLVNEILNLARIEAGHVEYEIVDADTHAVVFGILPLVEPQATKKEIRLECDVPEKLRVRCDIERTQQILLNLVSNAIKFTPTAGTIAIDAARQNDVVVITVRDTGIGIPSDMLESIFDPFVQVEMSRSRRGEGTGLGLAISRDLAEGMGGSLRATSVEGEGSTFYLTLPSSDSSGAAGDVA